MNDIIKKLFLNEKYFLCAVLASAIGFVLRAECALMPAFSDFPAAMNFLLCGCCMLVMYISYRRHSKNVMKGMMGALLALALSNAFNTAGTETPLEAVWSWVCILSLGALFVNHFLINSSRYASPVNIHLNQTLVLVVMASELLRFFLLLSSARQALEFVYALLFLLSELPFASAVICIETRLDLYRAEREEAGWSEESGYPNNCVEPEETSGQEEEKTDE